MNQIEEITVKLETIRNVLRETESIAIRLRGTDWFAWATAGGSNTVLMTAETGVGEVFITLDDAWILTDEIEAQRLQDEQIPRSLPYKFHVSPWTQISERESFVQELASNGKVLSDKPCSSLELPLPPALIRSRQILLVPEVERYRQVGKLASEAMTEVLTQAQPTWTEHQLAGTGAKALWQRGLHPALTLAAGDRRLPLYRHPLPTGEPIGRQAMLVFCARGHGLIVSLTRFVFFGKLDDKTQKLHHTIAAIEAAALDRSQIDTPLNVIYEALATAYRHQGYPHAIREHHQGGTAGYGAREIIAAPSTSDRLTAHMALAWNPSLPGAKIEDTFILHQDNSLENLSLDPQFPHAEVAGRLRAVPLER